MKSNEVTEGRYFVTWTDEHGLEQRRKAIVRNREFFDFGAIPCFKFATESWGIESSSKWIPISGFIATFEPVDPQPMNRQARQWTKEGNTPWQSFGEVGFIEAGRRYAESCNYPGGTTISVEVRDEFDGVEPVVFHFTRKVQHVCTNPRLGEK